MNNNIELYVFKGLKVSISREILEKQILEMDIEKFIQYAWQFQDNEYWPCEYWMPRECFKTEEAWHKYENEGDGHRLIRKERGVKLYWNLNYLTCLRKPERPYGCVG